MERPAGPALLVEGALPPVRKPGGAHLSGYARPVSDGGLAPATTRPVKAGLLDRRAEPRTSAAQRHCLRLTTAGHTTPLRRSRDTDAWDIRVGTGCFTVLAFVSQLPD
ncbi:hypothetical protein [Streptomyces sp. MMG1121]|uniref:hypothetical protein n=1 Tax=Streptomyces sp. MMG1121 TaxID=1415544 RepID=UPI0006ADE19E|nr:hypothetical protein [Streptomyces sp. MMG1121]